jgi:hypothetical protein
MRLACMCQLSMAPPSAQLLKPAGGVGACTVTDSSCASV